MRYSKRVVEVFTCMVGLSLLIGGIADAQTLPNGTATGNGYATAPANGTAPDAQQQQPNGATMPAPELYQPSYYPESYYHYAEGYPAVEVRAVPPARVQASVARAQFRMAQSGLDRMIRDMKRAFERSRDYSAALNEERDAFEQLQNARAEALRTLDDDASYQAAVALRRQMTEQIREVQAMEGTGPEDVLPMAEVKLSYASTATQMEAAALAADPDVQQARERLQRAHARLIELRQQFDMDVRTSPELQVARQSLQDARLSKLAAEVYLVGVLEARNLALNYAVYSQRNDIYKYLSYGHYGYYHPHQYRGGYGYRYPSVGYPIGWTTYPR